MYLYHFFDHRTGPFKSLTGLPDKEAKDILNRIKEERQGSMCAKRDDQYLERRKNLEGILKKEFISKGGTVYRDTPHYMVLGFSDWLNTWYEQTEYIKIPVEEFDLKSVSFTYGDSMPTFSDKVDDNKEYRKKLYFYDEICELIERYGWPQEWNADGRSGPERYIEAHVWSDEPINRYIQKHLEEIKNEKKYL